MACSVHFLHGLASNSLNLALNTYLLFALGVVYSKNL